MLFGILKAILVYYQNAFLAWNFVHRIDSFLYLTLKITANAKLPNEKLNSN
jgi:hypothetical protein